MLIKATVDYRYSNLVNQKTKPKCYIFVYAHIGKKLLQGIIILENNDYLSLNDFSCQDKSTHFVLVYDINPVVF